jgi:CubicO group peptidase (beta-lactamase class C family)
MAAVAFNTHGASAPELPKSVAVALQPFVERQALAGAVTLVATKDKVLSLEAVGFGDVAAKQPMQTNSLFWIASQSKPMTTAALMMLVDEGKVNVDDPVEKYLPEFKGQMVAVERDADHMLLRKPAHPIKVREILSHTSGLPFKSPMEEPTLDVLPLRDAVRSYALLPLQFEPGTKYLYSNAGINTAARILEVVSGISYEEFMEQRLFRPLGMKDTTFWPTDEQAARLAKSYKPVQKEKENALEEIPITQLRYPLTDRKRYPVPAGGLFSTARDVGLFSQMILNGGTFEGKRYLSEAAVKQMTSKQTGDAVPDGYGFGWFSGNGSFGHGGAYSTNMSIEPQRGLITIFLVQHAGFPGQEGPAIQKAFAEGVAGILAK